MKTYTVVCHGLYHKNYMTFRANSIDAAVRQFRNTGYRDWMSAFVSLENSKTSYEVRTRNGWYKNRDPK